MRVFTYIHFSRASYLYVSNKSVFSNNLKVKNYFIFINALKNMDNSTVTPPPLAFLGLKVLYNDLFVF